MKVGSLDGSCSDWYEDRGLGNWGWLLELALRPLRWINAGGFVLLVTTYSLVSMDFNWRVVLQ
jgi:hypothetical protein